MTDHPVDAIVSAMRWRAPDGTALRPTVRVGQALKDVEDRSRQVRAAQWEIEASAARPVVLKLRQWRGLKRRWLATRGRSPIAVEMSMMRAAADAGLRTAALVAHGVVRRLGLVAAEAMVTERYVDWPTLRQLGLRRFREQDPALLEAMASMLVAHVAAVRRAGLADRDCGGHNLLVRDESSLTEPPVWIDLEGVRRAAPDDAEATRLTCAAVLMGWWEHGSRDEVRFHAMWRRMTGALPEPAGGWRALIEPLNALLRDRGAKQVRHARAERPPPALSMS